MSQARSRPMEDTTLQLFRYDIYFHSNQKPLIMDFPLPLVDIIHLTHPDLSTPRAHVMTEQDPDLEYVLRSMRETAGVNFDDTILHYGPMTINLNQVFMAIPRTCAGTGKDIAYTVLGTRDMERDINFLGGAIVMTDLNGFTWPVPIPVPADPQNMASFERRPHYPLRTETHLDIQGVLFNPSLLQNYSVMSNQPDLFRQGVARYWKPSE